MHHVYSLLLFLALLVHLPIYLIRSKLVRREPLYLRERLGLSLPPEPGPGKTVWLHAVSVGEVLSLQNLVRRVKQDHPDWNVYVSSLTHSGLCMAGEKLGAADCMFCIPFDFRMILRRVFRILRPRVFVLVESELWPNLIREAGRQTRGVLLINGRISSRSAGRYRRVKGLMQKVLRPIDLFQVQTPKDRASLEGIGIEPERIQVCGNLKVEVQLPPLSEEEVREQRLSLGITSEQSVILAGSTHKGEDTPLLGAFSAALSRRPELRFILAPRHLDRIPEIEKLAGSLGLRARRKTEIEPGEPWDVLVLDTIGELARLYALADAAFIGGSLIPWGGQNLLEPAFYAKPVFFGPHMDNFAHLAEIFMQNRAARQVSQAKELQAMFLMEDADELRRMGVRARETLEALRGATGRALKAIEERMARG
jgi:3-deoxy-D-manno-octulosonic-acid transferase